MNVFILADDRAERTRYYPRILLGHVTGHRTTLEWYLTGWLLD